MTKLNAAIVDDFSRHVQYYNIKISPDGKHLAALVNVDGGKSLVFLDAETYKITYALNSGKKANRQIIIGLIMSESSFKLSNYVVHWKNH
ncbi:hypothetical protein [Colwellia sp. KU-HH00111]|uniref:hypothetical protein n=1 Tax=Colwellia sp. KU-HH00111 TaxID=3127652 RepID=UPI0033657EED